MIQRRNVISGVHRRHADDKILKGDGNPHARLLAFDSADGSCYLDGHWVNGNIGAKLVDEGQPALPIR